MGVQQNTANVTFAKPYKESDGTRSGFMWVAPIGTTLPTTPIAKLDAAFKGMGYISEDGLVEPASLSPADGIVDAGGETVAQGDPTFNKQWTGSFLEATNEDVITALYGSNNVTIDRTNGLLTINEESMSLEDHVIIVDELWKASNDFPNGRRVRHIMPRAQILITDDITHNSTTLVSYGFTVTAFPIAGYPAQKTLMQVPTTAPTRSIAPDDAPKSKAK